MEELEKLRKENAELKEALAKLEGEYALIKSKTGDDKKKEEMEAKESADKITKLEQENKDLKEVNSKMEQKNKEFADSANKAKILSDVEKLIVDKKITPAQKDYAVSILSDILSKPEQKLFKEGDKEVSEYERMFSFLSKGSVDVNDEGLSELGDKSVKDLDDKARQYAETNKVSYKEALIAVSTEEIKEEI